MIYYQIIYYNGDRCLGGHILEKRQLEAVKDFAHPYFQLFNLKVVNVRMEILYEPDSMKSNLKIQSIEVL